MSNPSWELVTGNAGWQPRDSTGECVHNDHLYILGGWYTPTTLNPRDVWKSPDGKNWSKVCDDAPWIQSDLPAAMSFKGKLYHMGGRKLPGTQVSNRVWSSDDGTDWQLVTDDAGWCPRLSMGYAVWKDRMWILGGTKSFYRHDETTLHNDVWCSDDGEHWTCVTEAAPWPMRGHHQAIVHDDKLYVVGGGKWVPDHSELNDVWFTEDGETWHCGTEHAGWTPRIWFGLESYRGYLWLFGGWAANTGNRNDTWYSKDGSTWHEFKSPTEWSPRHEIASWVFKDSLYAAAGHANPLTNEVWKLDLPAGWSG